MFRRVIIAISMLFLLSGCYMMPLALLGPATSSFSTASIIQSTITTSTNMVVKKTTGKSVSEHLFSALNEDLQQTYFPEKSENKFIIPKAKPAGI